MPDNTGSVVEGRMRNPSVKVKLFAAGLIMQFSCLMLLFSGDLRLNILQFLWVFSIMFAAYVYVIRLDTKGLNIIRILFILALLFRLTLFFAEPTLSDDIYRYIFSGRMIGEGFNPYLTPPDSHQLSHIRDEVYSKLNYPSATDSYPPLAQILFFTVTSASESVFFMKLPFILFDLATAFLLYRILAANGEDTNKVILYLWNPLVIIEVAGSGHLDSMPAFFTVLAIYYVTSNRKDRATLSYTAGVLSKFYPALLAPLFMRRIRDFILMAAFLMVSYALFFSGGFAVFTQLDVYLTSWRFNDGLHHLTYSLLESVGYGSYARNLLWLVYIIALVYLYRRSNLNIYQSAFLTIGLLLIITPTLHPWYLIWIAPLFVFIPSAAYIGLTGLVMLSYTFYIQWQELLAVKLLEYLAFYLILAYELRGKLI